ncbi:hypothetical protein PDG61_23640 [Mycolicibacterium sp. BiH015]|uniref:hypothetical protein n=1 Tax=Mycolicibacterium sp. BiH015 TaxID=3018808 RepID=UPI0022E1C93A|nr:hypothetical protein [Mycolicibacterium sp. BiH015]MDA2893922.1 hypothetical protein [Mycolicibacterium sp. BiH015]
MGVFTVSASLTESGIALRDPPGVRLPDVETVWFGAGDGFRLNFRHLPPVPGAPDMGPVMFVHGSGTRANLFCPPSILTLPALLSAAGFDVWLLNWRASIDLEPVPYTFDDAAVHDFPAAIAEIVKRTCSETKTVKAVVHCQGSHAFMMSIASGLLPEVTTVVANSTAMHPRVPWAARIKLPIALLTLGKMTEWFNPQFGLYASSFSARVMDALVRMFHHECDNAVCKHSSFTYGFGFPTLWSHDNLDEVTHDWIKGEFAHVPVSLFRQTHRCLKAGRLVPVRGYPDIPPGVARDVPRTDANCLFMCGSDNRTFHPRGMRRTFEHFLQRKAGVQQHWEIPRYGHLDTFLGKHSVDDVFPHVIAWLTEN